MRFRTELFPKQPPFLLDLNKPVLSVGSCFAQVIGERLRQFKFDTLLNPYGTIFNPSSLSALLYQSLNQQSFNSSLHLRFQERWLTYFMHSDVQAGSPEELNRKITTIQHQVNEYLTKAQALIFTMGSAWVYKHTESQQLVANCHKQPQKNFSKELLTPQEIVQGFEQWYAAAKKVNPQLKVILTVSPVRHEKDGLEENSLSKSILRYAVSLIQAKFPEEVYYFPSYELLLDDLRDYRFYAADLLHPSSEAQDYIWEKFSTSMLNEEALTFVKDWEPIQKALNHRPFNPASAAHQQFLSATSKKLSERNWPVSVEQEILHLQNQLNS